MSHAEWSNNQLQLTIKPAPAQTEHQDWSLVVDGARTYEFSDAETTATEHGDGTTFRWNAPTRPWNDGSTVNLQLVEKLDWEPTQHEDEGNTATTFTDFEDRGDRSFVYRVWPHNALGSAHHAYRSDWAFNHGDPGGEPDTAAALMTIDESTANDTEIAVNSPATGPPSISGTPQVGQTLTASTDGIADTDGIENATFAYQWLSNYSGADTEITAATDSSYTLSTAEVGKTITVRVTFTDDAGNDETLTSAATATVAAAPNQDATGIPSITGAPKVGQVLTADTTGIQDPDGTLNSTFTYQWSAAGNDIAGATSKTYTPQSVDAGKVINVNASFNDDLGNPESILSNPTAPVLPTTPSAPTNLTVAAQEPAELHASWQPPTDNGGATVSGYKVRWKEQAGSWSNPDDISEQSANATSHTITGLTSGTTYTVQVTAFNSTGESQPSNDAHGTPEAAAVNPLTGFTLVDASSQDEIAALTDGATVVLSDPGSGNYGIRATKMSDATIGSVHLELAGPKSVSRTENITPYSLYGDDGVNLNGETLPAGNYTITATAYSERNKGGDTMGTLELDFTVKPTLTVTVENQATSHDGSSAFTFELRFSEEPDPDFSYRTLRDHAFTVTQGRVAKARRIEPPGNVGWRIFVIPNGDGRVTVELAPTTDCTAVDAICTSDDRGLANTLNLTFPGPQ